MACGVLAVLAAVAAYWLIVPGVVLGTAAAVLGWRARRSGHLELGSVALTLGIVAVVLVPAINLIANGAEDWGRDCALQPAKEHC